MRLLVTGGRDFTDRDFVFHILDRIHAKRPITLLVEGGALGADALSRLWAICNNIPFQTCKADWERYGKAAGIIRNGTMLSDWNPQGCVAFPGGRGTADMVKKAENAGITVWIPKYISKVSSSS